METLLLIKLLAIALLVTGLSLALKPEELKKGVDSMFKESGTSFLAGIFTIYLGAFIVAYHNKWDTPWEIALSTLGYLALLKGFGIMTFPSHMKKISDGMFYQPKFFRLFGILIAVASLGLLYKVLWCGCLA